MYTVFGYKCGNIKLALCNSSIPTKRNCSRYKTNFDRFVKVISHKEDVKNSCFIGPIEKLGLIILGASSFEPSIYQQYLADGQHLL